MHTSSPCILTLISDTGKDTFSMARLKACILKQYPNAQFIDIDHNVAHFNTLEAAYKLRSSYPHFPLGTIHFVNVNLYYTEDYEILLFEQEGQIFIGPNNGIFSLVFSEVPSQIFRINPPLTTQKPLDSIADSIYAVLRGEKLNSWEICKAYDERLNIAPVVGKKEIRATIIYIDEYQNVITNISKNLFEEVKAGRQFALYFKRFDPINYISLHYGEVEIGETLCRFNSLGLLEIAINLGKAAEAFDLKLNDTIQIEFY